MTDTPKPVSRMGYPFKAKSGKAFADVQDAYEGLALADGGHFPLGNNGHFHGGIHFDRATANVFSIDDGVQCLADGEIVAYRLDRHYPDATPTVGANGSDTAQDGPALRPYSTGFVLVRHRLQPPALPAPASATGAAPTNTEPDYGARLATRPDGPTVGWLPIRARVALLELQDDWARVRVLPPLVATWTNEPVAEPWLPLDSLDNIPTRLPVRWFGAEPLTATVVLPSQPRPTSQRGRAQPSGTPTPPPSLVLYSLYMHLADGASYDAMPNRTRPRWWPKKHYRSGNRTTNEWTLHDELIQGLMVRSAPISKTDNELGILVRGSVIEIEPVAGNARWGIVRSVIEGGIATRPDGAQVTRLSSPGHVFLGELDEIPLPGSFDSIEVPSPPIPVSMGEVIGHMGQQVSSSETLIAGQPASRPTLHLEVFSAEDVPRFLRDSQRYADKLPERYWTLLRLRKGDALKGEPRDDATSISDLTADWTAPLTRETAVQQDDQGQRWVNVKIHRADGTIVQGWAKDKDRRQTPWHWPDFEVVDAASNDAGTWWDGTADVFVDFLRGGPRPPETPFFKQIREWVDSNHDGRLSEEELDAALRNLAVARRIGGLIAYHTSEWHVPSWASRYGVITDIATNLGKNAMDNVKAEKDCVMRLRWWSDVAAQVGLPQDARVYHFHPAGLAGYFSGPRQLVTVAMLRKIFPHAPDGRLAIVAEGVNENIDSGKLDSEERLCHFFGQVRQEVGDSMAFRENLNYSANQLFISRLGYYTGNRGRSDADAHNEVAIANNAYADANRPAGYKLGNTEPGDGWRYRGRGLKQLTGRENYRNFGATHKRVWGEYIDFEALPEKVDEPIYAVRSGLAFWVDKRLYAYADKGITREAADSVTAVINRGTASGDLRWKFVKEIWDARIFGGIF